MYSQVLNYRDVEGTTQQVYIKAPNVGEPFDHMGKTIAISSDGNVLAVGAVGEDGGGTGVNPPFNENAPESGAVYIYRRSGDTWNYEAYIKPSNTGANDLFGYSVSLSADGNTLAVGANHESGAGVNVNPDDNNNAPESGAAYVYTYGGAEWSFQAYLKANNTDAGDNFGFELALTSDGNTLAVGAPGEDGSGLGINPLSDNSMNNSGAVYIYTRDDANMWTFKDYLKANMPKDPWPSTAGIGSSVVWDEKGSMLVSGSSVLYPVDLNFSTGTDFTGQTSAAAVFIFKQENAVWNNNIKTIRPSYGNGIYNFGQDKALAVSGDGKTIAVWDYVLLPDINSGGINVHIPNSEWGNLHIGRVYVYTLIDGIWHEYIDILTQADISTSTHLFGRSVELNHDGTLIAISSPFGRPPSVHYEGVSPPPGYHINGGVITFFRRQNLVWSEKIEYTIQNNPQEFDGLGYGMALTPDGTTLAVGAFQETNCNTGINPVDDDSMDCFESGAAYVFNITNIPTSCLNYQKGFNLSQSPELISTKTINSPLASDMHISPNGKILVLARVDGEIARIILQNPYDLSDLSNTGYPGLYVRQTEIANLQFTYPRSGMRRYYINGNGIIEYNNSRPAFHVVGPSPIGTYYPSEFNDLKDIRFNDAANKLFLLGNGSQGTLRQYNLKSPQEIIRHYITLNKTSTVLNSIINSSSGGAFYISPEGLKLYAVDHDDGILHEFDFEIPFDITTLSSTGNTFDMSNLGTAFKTIDFKSQGNHMFILGDNGSNSKIYEFNIPSYKFVEDESIDNGTIPADEYLIISLNNDIFNNAGGVLTYGLDYTIDNLPNGLIPILSVHNSGAYAKLTLEGNAMDNEDIHDVDNLLFTWQHSAFKSGILPPNLCNTNDEVITNSGVGIDFNGYPLSVVDINDNNSILIYPNPTHNTIKIITDKKIKKIVIFDAAGKMVYYKVKSKNLNLNQLSSGIYFMKIFTPSGNETIKIIKK